MNNFKQFVISRKRLLIFIFVIIYIFLVPAFIFIFNKSDIFYKTADINTPYDIGIVFGAGLTKNGDPSDVLKDRLKSANKLYRDNKIMKILVSGDNRFENYNEPDVMKNYLINELGVEEKNIIIDYAGRRTYDTCIRAKNVFKINKAILITQEYHLPRAIFTCKALGIENIGFSATLQPYIKDSWFSLREFAAIHKSILDIYFLEPNYIK